MKTEPREIRVTEASRIWTGNKIHVGSAIHGSGTVVKKYSSLKPAKSMCSGCRDNYYNSGATSTDGECWMFKAAVVVDKIGYAHINVANGPNVRMKNTLDCWHSVQK